MALEALFSRLKVPHLGIILSRVSDQIRSIFFAFSGRSLTKSQIL